ncbi:DUF1460 domain-containing protein [Providencia heimbachae]|uniref:N-acetylmuramoyl-L-alanine amidase-like domain-containing protein n=1 Tax=Providencia heimbachae TaxID=333962 RepID=UPI0010BEB2E7|nr:N-acetylmuramoyl-L-alanine amidase-like domain-containing protein [Providencia heimbachae]QCJ68740.1 DUF1460 domain-containing protein [Providencia heimbachae]
MLKRLCAAAILLTPHLMSAEAVLTPGSYSILERVLVGSKGAQPEQKVKIITQELLGTPYNDNTLNMNYLSIERLTINLKAMDCMTFIEYAEAFKHAENYEQFLFYLANTRYINQDVSFSQRRHFFTDWAQEPESIAEDITTRISPHTIRVQKELNRGSNGELFLSGVDVKDRIINYIPSGYVDKDVIELLKTGDYVGIYSNNKGLDVTHVGIVIRENNKVIFRNASSLRNNFKVSDIELERYLQSKVGIIVLRSKINN